MGGADDAIDWAIDCPMDDRDCPIDCPMDWAISSNNCPIWKDTGGLLGKRYLYRAVPVFLLTKLVTGFSHDREGFLIGNLEAL